MSAVSLGFKAKLRLAADKPRNEMVAAEYEPFVFGSDSSQHSTMIKNLLITGAGVDRTKGIDFPLAATLLPEISAYLEKDGREVDKVLRSLLPNLRFTFSSMVARAVEVITTQGPDAQREMVKRVRDAIVGLPDGRAHIRRHGELIIRLFNKLVTIAEAGELDEEMRNLIREVFPQDADDLMDSDSLDSTTKTCPTSKTTSTSRGCCGRIWCSNRNRCFRIAQTVPSLFTILCRRIATRSP